MLGRRGVAIDAYAQRHKRAMDFRPPPTRLRILARAEVLRNSQSKHMEDGGGRVQGNGEHILATSGGTALARVALYPRGRAIPAGIEAAVDDASRTRRRFDSL
jgi:hypothetical protein